MSTPAQTPEIDFSAGLVPKPAPGPASGVVRPARPRAQAAAAPDQEIDFSAGLVPKDQGAAPAEAQPTDDKPGVLSRMGKEFAHQVGIPTSEDELRAAKPSLLDTAIGPAGTAAKMIYGYGKNLYEQGKQSFGEAYEAGRNIGEGGPVGANIGKAGAAASDLILKGALAPLGGEAVAKAGENFAAGDKTPEALGDVGAGALNVLTARDTLKGHPITEDLPKTQTIAGTDMPLTVGQAREIKNPATGGKVIKPLENLTQSLPGGSPLRTVGREQQAGAREILANKAATTGAEVSTAPENIEQNFANAVDKTRQEGSAKYEAIAEAAKDAPLTPSTIAAAEILGDPDTARILPNSARTALAKVGAALSNRDGISRQIYGRAASTLDADELANVIRAEETAPEGTTPFLGGGAMRSVMDARSELADAAHGMKDPADRFLVSKALDKYDAGLKDSLAEHDKLNGTNLGGDLQDAKQLWTQKYAFDKFRTGMQSIMRSIPSSGPREIPGQAFQRLVNQLDPPGKLPGRTSTLERMFPGDPQSVKDIHELADFMGKNQARAGGMGGMMARMRILGLKESAAGFLTNAAGFSYAMANRGIPRLLLNLYKGGQNTAKLIDVVGELNHLASHVGKEVLGGGLHHLKGEPGNGEPPSEIQPLRSLPNSQDISQTGDSTTAPITDNSLTTAPIENANTTTPTTAATQNSATPAANSNPNSILPPASDDQNVTTQPPLPQVAPGPGAAQVPPPGVFPVPGSPQAAAVEAANSAGRIQDEEAQAHRMASGLPAVPPAPPVPPPAPGIVSPDMVAAMGKKIAQMPPEQRAQATSEVHRELAHALLQQGKVSGPDGKIEIITKPEQADRIAQRIINDELKKQDKTSGQTGAAAATTATAPFRPSWKVVSTAPAQPPADLWKGKENKRLTLKDANGKTSRWELKNGKPVQVD